MSKNDIPILYEIALRAFASDYEKFGVYPPMINLKKKRFLPPRIFGKTIFKNDTIIGGAFVAGFGKKGEIGTIFIDPIYQHKGYGKQTIQMIEKTYPKIQKWRLDTPAENYKLHKFYESLGYVKIGENKDKKSSIAVFQYEKTIK
jgi:GNAT superfamily N-acetyltransferase